MWLRMTMEQVTLTQTPVVRDPQSAAQSRGKKIKISIGWGQTATRSLKTRFFWSFDTPWAQQKNV